MGVHRPPLTPLATVLNVVDDEAPGPTRRALARGRRATGETTGGFDNFA